MPLEFEFSPELELHRVEETIIKIKGGLYVSNRYEPILPQGIDPRTASREAISEAIKSEFNAENYGKIAKKLDEYYLFIEPDFVRAFRQIFGNSSNSEFRAILTRYDVGGSYRPPNTVLLNMDKDPEKIEKTLVHEICHLLIHPDIKKYKVLH